MHARALHMHWMSLRPRRAALHGEGEYNGCLEKFETEKWFQIAAIRTLDSKSMIFNK
jgi:hypothetical protein